MFPISLAHSLHRIRFSACHSLYPASRSSQDRVIRSHFNNKQSHGCKAVVPSLVDSGNSCLKSCLAELLRFSFSRVYP